MSALIYFVSVLTEITYDYEANQQAQGDGTQGYGG